jgi:hypothetical protein
MFEPPCNLGFDQEALTPDGIAAVLSSYFLEGDLPLELRVLGDENFAQAPSRMGPDNPIPNGLKVVSLFVVGHGTRRKRTPFSFDVVSAANLGPS